MRKINMSKMPSLQHKSIYNIFSYFISCAFIGWIFETLFVLIQTGHMTERGLLFINHNPGQYFPFLNSVPLLANIPLFWGLPIIEIYGIGGCIIVFCLGKLKNIPAIFFIGLVILTLLELGTSYICEIVAHKQYWDYSADFLNFQGRICLRSSIAWGILSVFTIKFLKAKMDLIWKKEKSIRNYKVVTTLLFAYTIFCMILKYFFDTK